MNHRIYLSPPHLNGTELDLVRAAFAANWVAPAGPDIEAFEKQMCSYTGARHAVALSSGTAALHLALQILGVGQGDEVLCSNFTFAGSVYPVCYCGALPVLVGSDAATWNMDPALLHKAIEDRLAHGKKPKAAIIVHLYGQSADMEPLMRICGQYGIAVIEDAAESLGATYKGAHTGTIADFGVYSFNGNKIITSSGGGMLVTTQKEYADRARYLATQARLPQVHYEHVEVGYNYRMSNIVAAIGRAQLDTIEQRVQQKRDVCEAYHNGLAHLPGIGFMPEADYGRANRWLTCMTFDTTRYGVDIVEQVRTALEKENIESRPVWKPMHLQKVFAQCPVYTNGVSDDLFGRGLCLPSGTALTRTQIQCIIDRIKACVQVRRDSVPY